MVQLETVPRTVPEMMEQYDLYISACIRKMGHGCVSLQDVPDLKQEVALRATESHYIERFNGERAQFKTYLYCLVRSVVVNDYERSTRDPLSEAVGIAVSLAAYRAACERGYHRQVVLELFAGLVDESFERRQMALDVVERIRERLSEGRCADCTEEALGSCSGSCAQTRLVRTWRLLGEGKPIKAIAEELGVGTGTVQYYVRLCRRAALKFKHERGAA